MHHRSSGQRSGENTAGPTDTQRITAKSYLIILEASHPRECTMEGYVMAETKSDAALLEYTPNGLFSYGLTGHLPQRVVRNACRIISQLHVSLGWLHAILACGGIG